LKRIRNVYAPRRAYLVQALTVNFGKAISIFQRQSGTASSGLAAERPNQTNFFWVREEGWFTALQHR